jgi:hypothetical protein
VIRFVTVKNSPPEQSPENLGFVPGKTSLGFVTGKTSLGFVTGKTSPN